MFDRNILTGLVRESSIDMYSSRWNAYMKFCGDEKDAIDHKSFEAWRTHLIRETKKSPSTINLCISSVKAMIRAAAQRGLVDNLVVADFSRVKVVPLSIMPDRTRKHNHTRISPSQMRCICNMPNLRTLKGLRDRAILLTMATSGARISEILDIKTDDIQDDGNGNYYASVIGKRDDAARHVLLSPEAYSAISDWLDTREVDTSYVFVGFAGRGRAPRDCPMTAAAAWKLVRKYADKAGINYVKPHDFRRFVGTQIGKNNLFQAQKVLGHKSVSTTYKYYVQAEVELGVTNDLF